MIKTRIEVKHYVDGDPSSTYTANLIYKTQKSLDKWIKKCGFGDGSTFSFHDYLDGYGFDVVTINADGSGSAVEHKNAGCDNCQEYDDATGIISPDVNECTVCGRECFVPI